MLVKAATDRFIYLHVYYDLYIHIYKYEDAIKWKPFSRYRPFVRESTSLVLPTLCEGIYVTGVTDPLWGNLRHWCYRPFVRESTSLVLPTLCEGIYVTGVTDPLWGNLRHWCYRPFVRESTSLVLPTLCEGIYVTGVTDPLWGNLRHWCYRPFVRESTSLVVSLTKASDAEIWCFLWSTPEQMVEQTIETPVIWDAIALITDVIVI